MQAITTRNDRSQRKFGLNKQRTNNRRMQTANLNNNKKR